jgi:hypothetical protein
MNNLFIAHTPLQLLTAYIIANTSYAKDRNYLVLLYRNSNYWNKCFSLKKMSSNGSTWEQIIIMENWLGRISKLSTFKQEINSMRAFIDGIGKVDRVFLGSDKTIQNQLIVELSGNLTYFRIEDGVWSYSSPDRRWGSEIWQLMRVNLLRKLVGVKPLLEYNLSGVGRGKAASADYLFKPDLLERPSPRAIKIERGDVQKAMEKLSQGMKQYPELSGQNVLLFLGSVFVERHTISLEEELTLLRKIQELGSHFGMTLVYKPHPVEGIEKLKSYREKLPGIYFIDISDPIEFIYFTHGNLKIVMAHSSSGLLYADLFAKSDIVTIALAGLYGQDQINLTTTGILLKAGTQFPKSFDELEVIFRNHIKDTNSLISKKA